MHILIAGGTGTFGIRLVEHLIRHGHLVTVMSRQPYKPATLPAKIRFAQWDGKSVTGWGHLIEEVGAVVNLAGAGLAEARWTAERKRVIVESRVNAGQALVEAISSAANKPKVLIQASAVGCYGTGNTAVIETAGFGNDFLAAVCKRWEASTEAVEEMGLRRVVIRTGVVLDDVGGALPKMVMPFRFFAGGPVGLGRQWVSWVHYLDGVEAIRFLLENETISGVVNVTSPYPVQNRGLAKAIGKAMRRPAFIPAPGFVLKMIYGKMSTVVLDGQQVLPGQLDTSGYQFKFPTVQQATQDLLG